MKWSPSAWFRSKKAAEQDEEIRKMRGQMAHAVVTNDRKAHELKQLMGRALRLREEYDK